MSEPTREEVLWVIRERIAHLEIHRGRGPIAARLHQLECLRAALRELEGHVGPPQEEGRVVVARAEPRGAA